MGKEALAWRAGCLHKWHRTGTDQLGMPQDLSIILLIHCQYHSFDFSFINTPTEDHYIIEITPRSLRFTAKGTS